MKGDIRYDVQDIANYFLSKDNDIIPKKLQKLLYFAYSWYLAIMNKSKDNIETKLFDGNFEAWIHGSVSPEIYNRYKAYGASIIERYEGELADFTEDDLDILEQVWDVYGKFTANQLESISKQHDPWVLTRKQAGCASNDWCNKKISDELIFDYYTRQLGGGKMSRSLNLDKIKNKPHKTVSTEEALQDVEPFIDYESLGRPFIIKDGMGQKFLEALMAIPKPPQEFKDECKRISKE